MCVTSLAFAITPDAAPVFAPRVGGTFNVKEFMDKSVADIIQVKPRTVIADEPAKPTVQVVAQSEAQEDDSSALLAKMSVAGGTGFIIGCAAANAGAIGLTLAERLAGFVGHTDIARLGDSPNLQINGRGLVLKMVGTVAAGLFLHKNSAQPIEGVVGDKYQKVTVPMALAAAVIFFSR